MSAPGHLVLTAGPWRAVLDPQLGGALLELSRGGAPVLRPATSEALAALGVRAAACFPLVPYANRIALGQLPAAGRVYELRRNFPPEPHAVHGIGWQRPWQVVSAQPSSAELRLHHAPEDPADWPFAFESRQQITLGPRGLKITLALTNCDREAWPAGIGLHPNFSLSKGETLQFEAAGAFTNGPDHLPEAPVNGGPWDFAQPRPIASLALDHDFHGWRGTARLGGGAGGALRLEASAVFSVLRVYTPVERGFFSVEPVTHIADAVHRAATPGSGYRLLAPGETLEGSLALEGES